MPLPSVIYVGAADYAVKTRKDKKMDNKRLLGETDTNNTAIEINLAQSDSSKRNTLLHEVFHAILWSSGFNRDVEMDAEEKLVQMLAPWTLGVLRDNPELVNYLLEK